MSFGAEPTYNEKLENAYPSARNSDPINRQVREVMFQLKDFGYDDFSKNSVIVSKFKQNGKLDDMMGIYAEVERSYNGGSGAPAQ